MRPEAGESLVRDAYRNYREGSIKVAEKQHATT